MSRVRLITPMARGLARSGSGAGVQATLVLQAAPEGGDGREGRRKTASSAGAAGRAAGNRGRGTRRPPQHAAWGAQRLDRGINEQLRSMQHAVGKAKRPVD